MTPIQLPLGVRLRDDATFANYYPGANAAALGYVERLCEADAGWTESLIYLWGGEGVGRSHLLQAACLRFEQRGEPAVYLPLAEVVEYGPALLDNLEQCELVCLDDLDAVAGRSDWEEALFHLFNRLRDSGRRLLLAASGSPRELKVQLADLQSRLTLALVFSTAYLGFGLAGRMAAEQRFEAALHQRGIATNEVRAVPIAFNSLVWRVMAKTADGHYFEGVSSVFDREPPEMLRRGRFDDIFFVGLPSQTERQAIFEVHLSRLRPHSLCQRRAFQGHREIFTSFPVIGHDHRGFQ